MFEKPDDFDSIIYVTRSIKKRTIPHFTLVGIKHSSTMFHQYICMVGTGALCHLTECHPTECHFPECHPTECHLD
jgi:hypothetical protein